MDGTIESSRILSLRPGGVRVAILTRLLEQFSRRVRARPFATLLIRAGVSPMPHLMIGMETDIPWHRIAEAHQMSKKIPEGKGVAGATESPPSSVVPVPTHTGELIGVTMDTGGPQRIAVLVPCYNEAATVAKVVADFRRELPQATVYVYDNDSSDDTATIAAGAGAVVVSERRRGKGNVIRAMFRDIDADFYVMVDGDDTYPPAAVSELLAPVRAAEADMVIGKRLAQFPERSFRRFHVIGNSFVVRLVNVLFGSTMSDVLSGYRVLAKRFVKTVPIMSSGFEVEAEMTISALDKGFRVREVPVDYGSRPEGSVSKLDTYRDGVLIVRTVLRVFKDYRPLLFFGSAGALLIAVGFVVGTPVILEFLRTGAIDRIPSAILATGLCVLGALQIGVGAILDTQAWLHRENYQNFRTLFEFLDRRIDDDR